MPKLLIEFTVVEIIPLSPSVFVEVSNKPNRGVKEYSGLWAQFGVCAVPNKI